MTFRALPGCADRAASGPLLAALAVSVVLHAALLAGLPDLWTYSARPATAPLNARLVPGARNTAVEPPAVTAQPSRLEMPPPTTSARKPSTIVAPAPPAVAVAEPAAPAPSPVEPVLALGAPTLAPRPGDDALEAGTLAQYRLALIGAAKRLKRYPGEAIDRGVEGRVDVRLVVDADGAPAAVTVGRSSGHDVLDREAMDTLRRAAAATPIPPALRKREIVVEIPLLYELKSGS